jgi:anti-sigma factor RsiW
MTDPVHVPCIAFVEMVTDYLEGALDPEVVSAIDEHLAVCPGCVTVVEQFRQVVRLGGVVGHDDVHAIDPGLRSTLMAAFGVWAADR